MPLRQEAQAGPSTGPTLWCTICHVAGKNVTNNCHLLQNLCRHRNNYSAISINQWAMMNVTTVAMN